MYFGILAQSGYNIDRVRYDRLRSALVHQNIAKVSDPPNKRKSTNVRVFLPWRGSLNFCRVDLDEENPVRCELIGRAT